MSAWEAFWTGLGVGWGTAAFVFVIVMKLEFRKAHKKLDELGFPRQKKDR